MNKKTKEIEVISKNTKGKKLKSKEGSMLNSFVSFIKKNVKSIVGLVIVLIVLVFILLGLKDSAMEKVVTIDGQVYTKSDFMIYLYSAKYNYFDDELENITDDDLNIVIDDENNVTVREYLKKLAISDIKTAAAIKNLASDNNIILTKEDYQQLEEEKLAFIEELGGKKEFKKFLNSNKTSEESYDKMSETDKLYKKILKSIYGKDKLKDLTEEEYKEADESYKTNYIKVKQIILATIDINTGKSLNVTSVNQKQTLAKTIVEKAKSGTNFDELIKKYSEDAEEKEAPYDIYYKKGELLSELETAIFSLEEGAISEPIQTKYAIHVVQKQKLDDSKLNEYYDSLREDKCIKDLKEYLDNLKVIYHGAYDNLKIK